MKLVLWVLTAIAVALSPAMSLAQSTPGDARKAEKAGEPRPAGDGAGAGQIMKDSWLTTKAKMALVTDKRVKARHIQVETQGGIVTLRGKVASAEERTATEEVARGISGATSVNSALQVVPEEQRKSVDAKDDGIEKAVKGRLDKDEYLKDTDIKVRSDNSVVTLIGKVPDHKTRVRASDLTRGVPGVRAVRNELAQKG
jgi:hyperosmotically inducible protein